MSQLFWSRRIWIFLVLIAAGLAGIGLGRTLLAPAPAAPAPVALESGTFLSPSRPLPAFELVDQDNRPVGADRLRGRWTLIFFGFTHCPEACPATLAILATVRQELARLVPPDQVPEIVLISVDPERDTPAVIKAYLTGFGPGFAGLTGDPAAVASLATALGVPYRKMPMDGDYMMDHSTAIMVVNPQAAVTGLLSAPHNIARLIGDYRRIVAGR